MVEVLEEGVSDLHFLWSCYYTYRLIAALTVWTVFNEIMIETKVCPPVCHFSSSVCVSRVLKPKSTHSSRKVQTATTSVVTKVLCSDSAIFILQIFKDVSLNRQQHLHQHWCKNSLSLGSINKVFDNKKIAVIIIHTASFTVEHETNNYSLLVHSIRVVILM